MECNGTSGSPTQYIIYASNMGQKGTQRKFVDFFMLQVKLSNKGREVYRVRVKGQRVMNFNFKSFLMTLILDFFDSNVCLILLNDLHMLGQESKQTTIFE